MKIIHTETLTEDILSKMGQTEKDWVYNGIDAAITLEIDRELDPLMDETSLATYALSLALQAPILDMNRRGILVDIAARDRSIASLAADEARVSAQFDRICRGAFGRTVNPNSPVQVKALMYDWLGLPEKKKRNSAGVYAPAVDRDSLEQLSQQYFIAEPFVRHILLSRDLHKQIVTLRTPLSPEGRYRTSLSIAGTKTGRLASSASDFADGNNLQNSDKRMKVIFIADPGKKFCNVDLEQADARNVGAMTWNLFPEYDGSLRLLDAAESGDLHTRVCRMCWTELPWTGNAKADREIADQKAYRNDSYRDLAKKLGHGTNFNGQPPTMAIHTKVAQHFITDFQRRYFAAFPEVEHRIAWVQQQLYAGGCLTTIFGRRRNFLKRPSDKRALNEACAFDPQSMTADEINRVMLRFYEIVKPRFPSAELLIQVHDSLLIQYDEADEDAIIPWIIEAFKVVIHLRGGRPFYVPCEVQVGWNWAYRQDWTAKDHAKGLCDASDIGRCKENPDGMIKYRGHDARKREFRFDAPVAA